MDCLPVMNGNLFHLLARSIMPNDFIHRKYITYYIIMSVYKITYNNNRWGKFISLGYIGKLASGGLITAAFQKITKIFSCL
jgi:hypothetical protein